MAKRKEPYIGKVSPHKDIPVLTEKAPDRPRKSPRGSKYRSSKSSGLAAFHSSERALARENKADTGRSKSRTGWGRFFRFGGGGGSPSAGQPKIGMRHGKARKEPKLQ